MKPSNGQSAVTSQTEIGTRLSIPPLYNSSRNVELERCSWTQCILFHWQSVHCPGLTMKFDDVVEAICPFGRFQKFQYFMVCLVGIPAALHTMVTVFILAVPVHRCAIPGLDNDTFESQGAWHDDLREQTIPLDTKTNTWDECKVFRHRNISYPFHPSNETATCERWVYSKEYFDLTVISELDLVCDDKDLVTLANSILMGGLLGGSLILGSLSDIIGRKKTMMIGLTGQFGVTLATGFVSNYIAFVVLRFLATFFGIGFFLAAFVAGMELVGPAQRTIAGIVIELFWALGLFIILFLAYFLTNWHHLQICVSCFNILFIPHFFLIPESARWLVSRGRIDEASAIVRKAAKMNGADVSEKVLSLQDLQSEGPQEKVWHLFTSPRLLVRCLIIFFNWIMVSMVYYGLGLNVGSLSGNLYLNFLYANIAETLSYVFCLVFLFRIGRRPLHCFTIIGGGLACVAIIFPVIYGTEDEEWITITLSMIGKFGISAAFAIIYVFSAELFPTLVRNSGMGSSSLMARIGGIASPYVADLGYFVSGDFGLALPSIIFGGLSVLAGICALFLPETLNKQLPETIEDAKEFGRDQNKNAYALEPVASDKDRKPGGYYTRY
ncbi:organic cation transporter protein-like isoform X2 [Babylonia areolata]|uniref:organic cation transporter protein-like isoform X2 n=1 Tax=Babylonia areolata TaxID=304850 RepID=UPI003FD53861